MEKMLLTLRIPGGHIETDPYCLFDSHRCTPEVLLQQPMQSEEPSRLEEHKVGKLNCLKWMFRCAIYAFLFSQFLSGFIFGARLPRSSSDHEWLYFIIRQALCVLCVTVCISQSRSCKWYGVRRAAPVRPLYACLSLQALRSGLRMGSTPTSHFWLFSFDSPSVFSNMVTQKPSFLEIPI